MKLVRATDFMEESDITDINKVIEFLESEDLKDYSFYEVCILWEVFSDSYDAQFLIVNQSTLNNFYEWLRKGGE